MFRLVINEEIWKPVVGYEGFYEVSNKGNVASLIFKGKQRRKKMKLTFHHCGYVYSHLFNGKIKNIFVHRLVAMAFPEICGEWFEGATVDHLNGIKTDNRAVNLKVCTLKENMSNPVTRQKHIEAAINNLNHIRH